MSNVLIGIIGVILFIGLALAGALFLGPRFMQASDDAKAAVMVESLTQVSKAVNLYEFTEGHDFEDGIVTSLFPQYLKSIPKNTGFKSNLLLASRDGARFIYASLNGMESVCRAINIRQQGSTDIPSLMYPWPFKGSAGCYITGASLVAWATI